MAGAENGLLLSSFVVFEVRLFIVVRQANSSLVFVRVCRLLEYLLARHLVSVNNAKKVEGMVF